MKFVSSNAIDTKPYEDKNLFQMLDTGIADMKAGREMPVADAFQMVTKLRERRRIERL